MDSGQVSPEGSSEQRLQSFVLSGREVAPGETGAAAASLALSLPQHTSLERINDALDSASLRKTPGARSQFKGSKFADQTLA
ncbi:hypothetical protein AAFF_G00092220 [Aldrovandia affinis]|uniref:Uncharacterized protein n=1 Tax=Aldrovandia affinis TaxID=143900 RepID=A0AAD7T4D7_9TELE|nr:hypothetical protein AAFF_G00092220 [Aldrovandia affinis]